jgi:hypothetical protein
MGDLVRFPHAYAQHPVHGAAAVEETTPALTPADVHQGIEQMRGLLLRAHDNLVDQADNAGVLARLSLGLAALQRDVAVWRRAAELMLVPLVERDGVDRVLDLGPEVGAVVTLTYGKKRTQWDSTRLYALIVQQAVESCPRRTLRVINDDGEVELLEGPEPDALVSAVATALHDCLPVTPSIGWRVTALRARGFDPAMFCTEESQAPSVQVTGTQ